MLQTDEFDRPILADPPETVNIAPIRVEGGPILLDWDALKTAYVDKDFPLKTYVKYALRMEYGATAAFINFDPEEFADSISGEAETSYGEKKIIQIHPSDVLKAIAELAKKQQLETTVQLQLTIHF